MENPIYGKSVAILRGRQARGAGCSPPGPPELVAMPCTARWRRVRQREVDPKCHMREASGLVQDVVALLLDRYRRAADLAMGGDVIFMSHV